MQNMPLNLHFVYWKTAWRRRGPARRLRRAFERWVSRNHPEKCFHLQHRCRKISTQERKFWLHGIVYHLEEPKSILFLAISWQNTPATSIKKSAEVRESSANMKHTLISLCACEKFQWLPSIHGGLSCSIDDTQGNNGNMQVSKTAKAWPGP